MDILSSVFDGFRRIETIDRIATIATIHDNAQQVLRHAL